MARPVGSNRLGQEVLQRRVLSPSWSVWARLGFEAKVRRGSQCFERAWRHMPMMASAGSRQRVSGRRQGIGGALAPLPPRGLKRDGFENDRNRALSDWCVRRGLLAGCRVFEEDVELSRSEKPLLLDPGFRRGRREAGGATTRSSRVDPVRPVMTLVQSSRSWRLLQYHERHARTARSRARAWWRALASLRFGQSGHAPSSRLLW